MSRRVTATLYIDLNREGRVVSQLHHVTHSHPPTSEKWSVYSRYPSIN